MTEAQLPLQPNPDEVERLSRRLGEVDARQVAIWRHMSPARRLDLAFQAHQFALETVRATEQRRHPDLSREELAVRVIQRLHGRGVLAGRVRR